jgi:hypothetical protein
MLEVFSVAYTIGNADGKAEGKLVLQVHICARRLLTK